MDFVTIFLLRMVFAQPEHFIIFNNFLNCTSGLRVARMSPLRGQFFLAQKSYARAIFCNAYFLRLVMAALIRFIVLVILKPGCQILLEARKNMNFVVNVRAGSLFFKI